MKREDLENNGIFIRETPADARALPPHIDKVRDTLLDLTWVVVDGMDDDNFPKKLDRLRLPAARRTLLEWCKTTRDEAIMLHKGQDREAEWQTFFLCSFFRPLANTGKPTNEDTRK